MNGFNQSYMYRSTETEKKGRKTRSHREDMCKCFPPFVKLHCHDCPVVMKPCPIHENFFHHTEKQQKVDREQNVIISFHPSTKTERLLQPIKTLLSHCNSETKINFQYYSPDNALGKESTKSQNGPTAYENIKRSFNNNVFVEKTKSFVANKTNKVKKLKQCFHSPCNSIAQRTRSQTSVKDKINQILREETKQNFFYNLVPEIPPDEKKFEHPSKWFSSKGSFKQDLLADEKLDSDFITVTQQDKKNAIHHKVFEIKHRKGVNDIPFVGLAKQPSHFVYSAVNVTGGQKATEQEYSNQKYRDDERAVREETEESERNLDACSSGKTNRSMGSSSSGSVYITPFIFVPKGMEDSAMDLGPKVKEVAQMDEAVQVGSLRGCTKQTQTSNLNVSSEKHPPEERNCRAVQATSLIFEKTVCHSSRSFYVRDYEPQSATMVDETFIDNERALMTRNFDEDSSRQDTNSDGMRKSPSSSPKTRTTDTQTCSGCPAGDVLIEAHWKGGMRDQTSQTEGLWNIQVSLKRFACKANKSQITAPHSTGTQFSDKGTQASSRNSPDNSEFIQLHSPNVTYVIKPFDEQESDQAIDKFAKTCWGKSHSDSDLLDRLKCVCCRGDNENPLMRASLSKHSNIPSGGKSTCTGAYESGTVAKKEMENDCKTGKITLRTKETVERFSETKQTSTREEELFAAVSDLSELKKIIQEFFEKRNLTCNRVCECETSKLKETKTSNETSNEFFEKRNLTCNRICECETSKLKETKTSNETSNEFFEKRNLTCNRVCECETSKLKETKTSNETNNEFFEKRNLTCNRICECETSKLKETKTSNETNNEFFEKTNLTCNKVCECETSKLKETKTSNETTPDTDSQPLKLEESKTCDKATQTTPDLMPKTSVSSQGVQTSEMRKGADTEVQTSVEFVKKPEKIDVGVQTNIQALLNESEDEKQDPEKVKFSKTAIVDHENKPKAFCICSVCGREMRNSKNVEKNTDPSRSHHAPERHTKSTSPEAQCFESFEIKMRSKKVDQKQSRGCNVNQGSRRVEVKNYTNSEKIQNIKSREEATQGSKIPVPNQFSHVGSKNNPPCSSSRAQRCAEYFGPDWVQKVTTSSCQTSQITTKPRRECICDAIAGPSTRKDALTNSKPNWEKRHSKADVPPGSRREPLDGQNNRTAESQGNESKTRQINQNFSIFPVLFTPLWAESILKSRKLAEKSEDDIPTSYFSRPQITKPKRSYEKDLETAVGKKIKVDANECSEEYLPDLVDLLKDGQLEDFKILTSLMAQYPNLQEDERICSSVSDEQITENLVLSRNENSPENDEDFLEEQLSDSIEDTEEEEEGESTSEENGAQQFQPYITMVPKVKSQSYSTVSFNKSFSDATTSKSVNGFTYLKNPKKMKRARKKQLKKK